MICVRSRYEYAAVERSFFLNSLQRLTLTHEAQDSDMTRTTRSIFSASAILALLLAASSVVNAESVKKYAVESRGGVPTLTIDGQPTRARIFHGVPRSRPFEARPEFAHYETSFFAEDDAPGIGTIHFRFGKTPGKIVLDNIQLIEKESGKVVAGKYDFENPTDFTEHWEYWHDVVKGETIAELQVEKGAGVDGSNGMAINIVAAPDDKIYDFHFFHQRSLTIKKGVEYTLSFDAWSSSPRGLHIALYSPEEPAYKFIASCGVSSLAKQTKLAANAGVNIVSFLADAHSWFEPDGTCDWKRYDAACDLILKANPNALLVPRLMIDASPEWLEKNPDALEIWRNAGKDHDNQGWNWASVSSKKYREAACAVLADAVRHFEEKYGDHILGYHPCGQNTQEWFIPNTLTEGDAGFSDDDVNAFREWLANRYANDNELRNAWGDDKVTLADAQVPAPELRMASRKAPYIESRQYLDFNEFWQTRITSLLKELASVVKRETNNRKVTFFFYGYTHELSCVGKGAAASGHFALMDLISSPDVDVICSPISYSERQYGGGCSCMLSAESVSRAGKMYLYEDDSRTYIADAQGETLASVQTPEQSVNILLRNASQAAERNFGTWLMDLPGAGWYDSEEIWAASAALKPMDEYFLRNPTPYRPEISLFLSEKAAQKLSSKDFAMEPVYRMRERLNRVGAPYSQYDVKDLVDGTAFPGKLAVVLLDGALEGAEKDAVDALEAAGETKVVRVDMTPVMTDELRARAADAGVWIYTDVPCNVWANGPFVTLHAPVDGEYLFTAPEGTKQLVDFITGKVLAEGSSVSLSLKLGDTKIIKLVR